MANEDLIGRHIVTAVGRAQIIGSLDDEPDTVLIEYPDEEISTMNADVARTIINQSGVDA